MQSSGVLADSIQRSRLKWITEGLFETYWKKPPRAKKGVVHVEDPKNPPKDSMSKLGQVSLTIEPHIFDVTLWVVRDHKAPHPGDHPGQWPRLQYGPPGGVMPAPPPPAQLAKPPAAKPPLAAPSVATTASPSAPQTSQPGTPNMSGAPRQAPADSPAPAPAKPPADPVIVTLAAMAAKDPSMKELMKRVADGDSRQEELQRFQKIIDEIQEEHRRKSMTNTVPADKVFVDGRSIQYFADEVRTISDMLLRAYPGQRSDDLKPPAGSDRLVVLLVKKALDNSATKDMIRRIADKKPNWSDVTDLQKIVEQLVETLTPAQNRAAPGRQVDAIKTNGFANGNHHGSGPPTPSSSSPSGAAPGTQHPGLSVGHPGLRSKGPPPMSQRSDLAHVVLEFTGGNGDRYLFPRFSILEYLPDGQQVLASFLIVRKGSKSDYGGDPALDYYQPVTLRFFCNKPHRHLDALAKVVAPPDEVRRYMEDVMDNMTRAEYVLLAMRLPRAPGTAAAAAALAETKDKDGSEGSAAAANGSASKGTGTQAVTASDGPPKPTSVLWTTSATPAAAAPPSSTAVVPPVSNGRTKEDKYQTFVESISRKTEVAE